MKFGGKVLSAALCGLLTVSFAGCNGSGDFGVYVQKTIHVHTITSIFSFIRASNASSVSASLMVSVPSMEMEEAAEPAMVDLLRSLP